MVNITAKKLTLFHKRIIKERVRVTSKHDTYTNNVISMYVVGTKPSVHSFIRRTRVQPSPWSNSITCNSSPSFIGILPSLEAVKREKDVVKTLNVITRKRKTNLQRDTELDTCLVAAVVLDRRNYRRWFVRLHFPVRIRVEMCVTCLSHFRD